MKMKSSLRPFSQAFSSESGLSFSCTAFLALDFICGESSLTFKLLLIFNSELIQSSVLVLKQILSPRLKIQPGIFRHETVLSSDLEITMISLLLTLTPGSVVMEVSPEGNVLYVHAMDVESERGAILSQLKNFEKAIMEVTR